MATIEDWCLFWSSAFVGFHTQVFDLLASKAQLREAKWSRSCQSENVFIGSDPLKSKLIFQEAEVSSHFGMFE